MLNEQEFVKPKGSLARESRTSRAFAADVLPASARVEPPREQVHNQNNLRLHLCKIGPDASLHRDISGHDSRLRHRSDRKQWIINLRAAMSCAHLSAFAAQDQTLGR
jgi:hypothetical protein